MALNDSVQAILTVRGLVGSPVVDYTLTDPGDGVPVISRWDPALGAQPTPAELAAVTPQQVTAAVTAKADRDAVGQVDQKVLTALALGLWENTPSPNFTKVQLRARILAIWKTL